MCQELILSEAEDIGRELLELLRPGCIRLEVAGSLRRRSPEVWDIELVAVPRNSPFDELAPAVARGFANHLLAPGPPSKNMSRAPDGDRYKRLTHIPSGCQVDLFIVRPPADWGVIYTIRTGPANFSHHIVTVALMQGKKVEDGQLWEIKRSARWDLKAPDCLKLLNKVPCPEEVDFFRALGYKVIPPEQRYLATDPGGLAQWKL